MKTEYQDWLDESKENEVGRKKFLRKARKFNSRRLDNAFAANHDAVFEKTDCLECANCCKTTSPIFRDIDINRISKHLKMKTSEFVKQYLHLDDDDDYVLNSSPCTFLDTDNSCMIYDARPKACRDYPHTNRKNMQGILGLAIKNIEICPAAARIVRLLEEQL